MRGPGIRSCFGNRWTSAAASKDWGRLFEMDFSTDGRVLFGADMGSVNGIGAEHVFTYEDDERGNWIRRHDQVVSRSGGELWTGAGEVLVRRLEYYD